MDGSAIQSRPIGKLLCFVFFLSLNSFSFEPHFQFARFGVYGTGYFQPDSAKSFSGLLLWSPARPLSDKMTLLADIGATVLNTPVSKFFVVHLAPRFDYRISTSVSVDLSVGTQNWIAEGGFLPMAGLGINYHFEDSPLWNVKNIRLAGNRIWKTDFPTWQVLLGIEFEFGDAEKPVTEKTAPIPVASPTPTPAASSAEIQSTEEGIKLTLSSKRISFAIGKADLPASAVGYLTAIGKAFVTNHGEWSALNLSGHTDDRGAAVKNEALSLSRAQSVMKLFSDLGVPPEKMKVRGAGATEPVASNDTPEGRATNRRVEIVIKADPAQSHALKTDLEKIHQEFSEAKP